jgi:hypothetical protein
VPCDSQPFHLDHEPLTAPEEVGLDGGELVNVEPPVDLRVGQIGRAAERQGPLLELGVRECRFLQVREHVPQDARPAAAVGSSEDIFDSAQVEQPQNLGLFDRPLEAAGV